MKAPLRLLSLALLAATAPAFAAEPAPAAATAPAAGDFVSKLQDIAAQLDLTAEQKAKIAPVLQQEAAELRALKADAGQRRLQKLRQFREINQKASDQIRGLLTPAQQPKYDELRAAARAEMKQKLKERRAAGSS